MDDGPSGQRERASTRHFLNILVMDALYSHGVQSWLVVAHAELPVRVHAPSPDRTFLAHGGAKRAANGDVFEENILVEGLEALWG